MKLTKETLTIFFIEAIIGFTLWTVLLTPWMIFVAQLSLIQYLYWILAGAIMSPWISVIVVRVTNKTIQKYGKKKKGV
jgi:hypothetical protein